jgi:hypothetical protein
MKFCAGWFNIYLAFAIVLCSGCETSSQRLSKEEFSTLRLFLEGNSADVAGEGQVQVTREKIPLTVQREPILTEGDLSHAALVDYPDGTFAIQVTFNDHGTLVLDMTTTAYKGKRIIVFSQFPNPGKIKGKKNDFTDSPDATDLTADEGTPLKPRTSAWLGAVMIRSRIGTGSFRFTPDASRKEAERIVRGLNNLIAEVAKKNKEGS